jgi:hypothetical protein
MCACSDTYKATWRGLYQGLNAAGNVAWGVVPVDKCKVSGSAEMAQLRNAGAPSGLEKLAGKLLSALSYIVRRRGSVRTYSVVADAYSGTSVVVAVYCCMIMLICTVMHDIPKW